MTEPDAGQVGGTVSESHVGTGAAILALDSGGVSRCDPGMQPGQVTFILAEIGVLLSPLVALEKNESQVLPPGAANVRRQGTQGNAQGLLLC